jgi:hypothetical protein
MPDDDGTFPESFLKKIESDGIDDGVLEELGKLTTDQRDHLSALLLSRKEKRAQLN